MQWNLIRLRKEAGLTQKDLAKMIGVNITTYVNKEAGEYQFKSNEMFILRDYFQKPIEDIFLPPNCIDSAVNCK